MPNDRNFYSSIELDSLTEQVLSALPNQVAIVNEYGEVIASNQKWNSLSNKVIEKWAFPDLGKNVLEELQAPLSQNNEYALRLIVAYKAVLSGEKRKLKVHFPVTRNSDDERWFSLSISILDDKKHFLLVNQKVSANKRIASEQPADRNSEHFFRKLFNSSPNAIAILDKKGQVIDINKSFHRIFGYDISELSNNHLPDFIVSSEQKRNSDELLSQVFQGADFRIETVRISKSGKNIPVILSLYPIREQSEITSVFCIYVDMTEQMKSKEIIEHQLKEKEVLIQEIHHRVKNNLAIISGLIELENIYTQNEPLKTQLAVTQSRIHSIAKIHELLYSNQSFSNIDFQEYVKDLTVSFSRSSMFNFSVTTNSPVFLNVNQAVPCGMLLHEITTQIVSKAKSKGINPHNIRFNLNDKEGELSIDICEEGMQKAFNIDEVQKDTLQSELISVLLKQLDGDINITQNPSNCTTVSFKKREKKGAHSTLL